MQPMNGKPSSGSNVSQATEEKLSNRAKRKIEQEREQQRRRIFGVVSGVLAIAIVAVPRVMSSASLGRFRMSTRYPLINKTIAAKMLDRLVK